MIEIPQRTIVISNIPRAYSSDSLRQIFRDELFQAIHIPADHLDHPIGVLYITLDTCNHQEQFLRTLNTEQRDRFLFIPDFLYNGPLLVEPYGLPEPELARNPHIKFQMTSPTDTIAIKLGQLFMKADDERKLRLSEGIDAIKEIEKQDALRTLEELKQNIQMHEEGARRLKEEARDMYERSQAMKQLLSTNQEEFNKRFKRGSAEE